MSDLETLQDFLQSASNHLVWLNEKEEIELTRDWSDRDLNVANVQQYYHVRYLFIFILHVKIKGQIKLVSHGEFIFLDFFIKVRFCPQFLFFEINRLRVIFNL